jgi:probable HAF family extracellular repeat protein
MRLWIFTKTCVVLAGFCTTICHAQNRYVITDLGTLDGASTVAHKINALGHAAGTSGQRDGGGAHTALWTEVEKSLTPLSSLEDSDYSEATTINNRDEMAGLCNTRDNMRAVLWSTSGAIKDLGTLPGDTSSRAFGINDKGKVVGLSSGPRGERAFVWSHEDGMIAVMVPPGTKSSEAHGINNRDQIVGDFLGSAGTHAYLWTPRSGVQDLGVIPGYTSSKATSINDVGEVVGSSSGPSGTKSFIWTPTEGIHAIDDIPSAEFNEALDINNNEEIVGTYEGSLGNRAFLWTRGNGFVDLNSLLPSASGLVLTMGISINDRGQILAIGLAHPDISPDRHISQDDEDDLHSVDVHSFLLTPRSAGLRHY